MPALYVEKVPAEIYAALRKRAQDNRTSISAEVLALLEDGVPSRRELARRRQLLEQALKLRARPSPKAGPFPSAEEMLAEDRRT